MQEPLIEIPLRRPRGVLAALGLLIVVLLALAILPSVWPQAFPMLNGVRVDTDPENMLPANEPVRVFHNAMKEVYGLNEIVVVGVVNETHPAGVFNVASLGRLHALTRYAETLRWESDGEGSALRGVIPADVMALSTVDNIEPEGPGAVRFEWLMNEPPTTEAEALAIRDKAQRIPMIDGTLVSEDGRAVALYIPVTSKDVSYRVSTALQEKIDALGGDERWFITGLPVANDTFGVEMFKQMAISAPMAMLAIFVLLFLFFRKLVLIVSPMLVALVAVIVTMGALVISGQTVHIMSSMIPIFIMPIAVLDSVHILSEFFDRYPRTRDRLQTLREVMRELFMPMLYTSLTSMAGFASLALTPNPPVEVFGIFVALGVLSAWLATILLIPAYIMLIPEARLEGFGAAHGDDAHSGGGLQRLGAFTHRRARAVLASALLLAAGSVYGIARIQINDNPVRWFTRAHPIRVADEVLNQHFGGTYMAYLALEGKRDGGPAMSLADEVRAAVGEQPGAAEAMKEIAPWLQDGSTSAVARATAHVDRRLDEVSDAQYAGYDAVLAALESVGEPPGVFKRPESLRYLERLQADLLALDTVGKVNGLPDIVKTVHRELLERDPNAYRIPDTPAAVAQCLITYQGGHRPQDLWHFVTPDYDRSVLWIQLRSGDNRDMAEIIGRVNDFFAQHPPPAGITHRWFGLTYINVVWQQQMVRGMLTAFIGSFMVVFLMMALLFRSALWGLLSMVPLTLTIAFMYGLVGMVGKDYDMPIAVLSALTLGLAVDFAIHFLARSRATMAAGHAATWREAVREMFGEPARAITRNIVVIAVGFTPLLFAPLIPYRTVGVFMATILLVAGVATLLLLPALLTLLERWAFPKSPAPFLRHCMGRAVIALAAVAVIVINVPALRSLAGTTLGLIAVATVALSAVSCRLTPLCSNQKGDKK